jgi:predicted TPR repeat methyltransferase
MALAKLTGADATQQKLDAAQRFIAHGDFKSAAASLNDAQSAAPDDARVFVMASNLGHSLSNANAALQAATRAITLAPAWPPAIMAVARARSALNEHVEAAKLAEQAVRLAMNDVGMLEMATSVANRALNFSDAERYLRAALLVAADRADVKRALAVSLQRQNKFAEAIELFSALINKNANDELALQGRAGCYLSTNQKALAKADYEALLVMLPSDAMYQYFHAVANGETPPLQPAELNAKFFDDYATNYDAHLVNGLDYQAAKLMAQAVRDQFPSLDISVLDLGCGTGLVGVYLGRPKGALVGVDVSTKMVAQAIKRNLYDRFHTVNLVDALAHTPAEQYEVITACDVFNYVGALDQLIADAHKVLRAKGALFFTAESAGKGEADLTLQSTGRYAHNAAALEKICKAAGFTDVTTKTIPLRQENGVMMEGLLVVAQKA